MINLDDEDLTKIDRHIIRFKIVSNAIEMLVDVTVKSGQKYGGTVCIRYGLIELRNFLKAYDSFLEIIDERRKKWVLDLCPFLEEILKYRKQIKYDRDNWVAHIKEEGKMIEENHDKEDIKFEEFLKMFVGVHRFQEGISKIFFEEYDNLARNLSKGEDEVFKKNEMNNEAFQQENRHKVEMVNKKLALDGAGFQLDASW